MSAITISNPESNHTFQSDTELVSLARQNDRDAFGALISRHYSACVRLATFVLRNRGEAEEEVQNACLKAYKHLDQYHGDAGFEAWLSQIVVNQCLMLMRIKSRARMLHLDDKTGRESEGSIDLPAVAPDPERELIDRQMGDVLRKEIQRIPKSLRSVILLRDVQQLPILDVAQLLGITVPAAKSRLLRARLQLRQRVLRFYGRSEHYTPRSIVQSLPAKPVHHMVWKT
jgi:RNA polymerase sigma-70 factor (ECF subfamily)